MLEKNEITSPESKKTKGLIAYARSKSIQKEHDVDEAIRRLVKDNRPINFNSVANEAHVTKAYLYNHPFHRERIEEIRTKQQGSSQKGKPMRQNVSDKSKDIIIAAKIKRINALEAENKELKQELEILRGKLYDSY